MGVDVDEAGGDDLAGGVDLAPGGAADLADLDDAVAVDRDVALEGRRARAVDDGAATNNQIPLDGSPARIAVFYG